MIITATEFKMNFGKYLDLSRVSDIEITKNGKTIAILSGTKKDAVSELSGLLSGRIPNGFDRHSLKNMKVGKYDY